MKTQKRNIPASTYKNSILILCLILQGLYAHSLPIQMYYLHKSTFSHIVMDWRLKKIQIELAAIF